MEAGIIHAPLANSVWEISTAFAMHRLVLESSDLPRPKFAEGEREESVRILENFHPQQYYGLHILLFGMKYNL
jgi:hypothetical protein